MWRDLQFAFRQLRKRPGFTLIATLVLALGLGANAAIFSVVNALLLQPLPFSHPETLVNVFERDVVGSSEDDHYNGVSPGMFNEWRREAHSVSSLAAVWPTAFNISSKAESLAPQRINGIACSSNFLSVLGVSPALGRFFTKPEDAQDANRVVVLSHRYWQSRFGAQAGILGRQIRLDDNSYTVIGILPAHFAYPGEPADVFVSFERSLDTFNRGNYSNHFFHVIGRLAPGISVPQAQEELSKIVRQVRHDRPHDITGKASTVILFDRYLVRDFKTALLILLAAVGCLLLIACVNVANLLLSRALGRQRELAIRAAVGASRAQIVRQLLIESVTISLLGALAGLVVAGWTSTFLATHAPGVERLPQTANIRIDRAVFFFTTAMAVLTGIAAGLFPAIAASATDLVNGLKESSRSATAGRSHGYLRGTLVAVEVALSLVLLIGAGLLLRSFYNVQNVPPGFRADHSVSFAVSLPDASYKQREAVGNFAQRFSTALRTVPGVQSAGLVSHPPLAGSHNDSVFHIEGHPVPAGFMIDLVTRSVDPGYFHAVGISLLSGRSFTAQDGVGFDQMHPRLGQVLISQSAVREFFHNLNPVGQIVGYGADAGPPPDPEGYPPTRYRIVGVVGDVPTSVEEGIRPTVYFPIFDGDEKRFYAVVHATGNPMPLVASLRATVRKLDANIPVYDVRTFGQINASVTGDRRFSASLLALFAGVALLLAAVGLYGVVSQAVTQRTSELGIRLALGASRANISRVILLGGLRPALIGIASGLLASFAVSRLLQSLLVGVTSVDALTFLAVSLLLCAVVTAACLVPAYRAARIDPTVALRSE